MTKRKVRKRKISPLLAIAGIGAGAYFLLNSQKAQAQEMPPAGIGSGYGGGAVLGTSGSPTTSAPTSSTGQPVYNISFEAPAFESQNYGQEASVLTKKDALTQPTSPSGGYSSEILQQSFKTEAEGKKAEADARAKKQPSGSSYFNLPQNDAYKYFNIPQQAKPTTTAKKQPTSPNPTAPFTPAQAVSLVPTAIINPIGAVAQASGFLLGNFFGGR